MARNDRRRDKNRRQARKEEQRLGNEQPQTPDAGDEDVRDQKAHHDLMEDAEGAPNPIEHATPDAELSAAQMALGRPELANVPDEDELEAFEEEQFEHDQAEEGSAAGALSTSSSSGRREHRERHDHVAVPDQKISAPARLIGFVRGSWTELQRVQWPDRRQVAQATGVVLGFVIVAGAFLGVADLVASKLVNLILK